MYAFSLAVQQIDFNTFYTEENFNDNWNNEISNAY